MPEQQYRRALHETHTTANETAPGDEQTSKSYSEDDGSAPKSTVFMLAPFNPSSQQIQEKALEHLRLTGEDVLFDLGCGDGRFLCHTAAQIPDLRCVGIEIDPIFVERARERVLALPENVQARIDIRCGDALECGRGGDLKIVQHNAEIERTQSTSTGKDLGRASLCDLTLLDDATALYLFVLPKGIEKLMPILNEVVEQRRAKREVQKTNASTNCLKRLRVLSYMFEIHDWKPTSVDRTAKGGCPIYLYEWDEVEVAH